MEIVKDFSSPGLSPEFKKGEKYALQSAKSIHSKSGKGGQSSSHFGFGRDKTSQYNLWRMYADGNQPTQHLKNRLSQLRNIGKGKRNLSFLTLSWETLGIAPKVVENIVGKLIDVDLETEVNAIDPLSKSEREEQKYRLVSFLKSKGFLEKLAKDGAINMDEFNPIPEGVPMPEATDDIDTYFNLFFKNKLTEEFKDLIDIGFDYNQTKQKMEEFATHLVKVGSAALWLEMKPDGTPVHYTPDPADVVTSYSEKPDFSDANWYGWYRKVTISELREIWPGQSEEVYRKVANSCSRGKYGGTYHKYVDYYNEHFHYPYDNETVEILYAKWQSVDQVNHVLKNTNGRLRVYKKNPDWIRDISEQEYTSKHPDRKPIKKEIQNWYACKWIVGTNYVFDHGPETNMLRDKSNLSISRPNIVLRRVPPLMKVLKSIFDEIDINWIKFKHHAQNSRPNGLAIEMSAFENLKLTQHGKAMSPKEALAMYFETGTIVWRRKSWRGSEAQFKPIEEMKNGLNQAAFDHFEIALGLINLLREISGIPEIADGTVSNPRIGKAVVEHALGGAKDTMKKLFNAYLYSYNDVARKTLDLTMDSITYYGGDMYKKALGIDSVAFLSIVKNLSAREFSITIQMGFDQEQRQEINDLIIAAQNNGQIDPEIAYMLKKIKNPYKAVLLLKHHSAQKRKQEMEMKQAEYEAQSKTNIESANAAAEAEKQKLAAKLEADKELELFKAKLQDASENLRASNELLNTMLQAEGEDKDRFKDLAIARIQSQNKPQQKASA